MMGITQLFVLSTRTMQWFEERGTHAQTYLHDDPFPDLSVLSCPVLSSPLNIYQYMICSHLSLSPLISSHLFNTTSFILSHLFLLYSFIHFYSPSNSSSSHILSSLLTHLFNTTGFILSDPSLLPPTRKYNSSRGSKVYIKVLRSQRDIDAEELLWNV